MRVGVGVGARARVKVSVRVWVWVGFGLGSGSSWGPGRGSSWACHERGHVGRRSVGKAVARHVGGQPQPKQRHRRRFERCPERTEGKQLAI